MKNPSILFICKKNDCYGFVSYTRRSSGLFNSTQFIVKALRSRGIDAHIVEVTDNNDIDREVSKFKPSLVVIEALWVVPDKFDTLKQLHPRVKWFVHLHSQIPFLALEGVAIEWLFGYAQRGIGVITNSRACGDALRTLFIPQQITDLRNVYLTHPSVPPCCPSKASKTTIDIGCFGAIRPFKNHLEQALAAIEFAHQKGQRLKFYINASRVETGGEPVLKNLIQLFKKTSGTELVQLPWLEPEDFLHLLRTRIDLALQVSFTETFNVVTADAITTGVPVVVSEEIDWVCGLNQVSDFTVTKLVHTMHRVWKNRILAAWNQHLLKAYSQNAQSDWLHFIHKHRTH